MTAPARRLVKAHAYGNDFLLGPAAEFAGLTDLPAFARQLCDRHRGVGADGLMTFERTDAGARARLLNADGSPSEVSGNGVRCLAAFLAIDRGLDTGARLQIDTDAGPKILTLLARTGQTEIGRAHV